MIWNTIHSLIGKIDYMIYKESGIGRIDDMIYKESGIGRIDYMIYNTIRDRENRWYEIQYTHW